MPSRGGYDEPLKSPSFLPRRPKSPSPWLKLSTASFKRLKLILFVLAIPPTLILATGWHRNPPSIRSRGLELSEDGTQHHDHAPYPELLNAFFIDDGENQGNEDMMGEHEFREDGMLVISPNGRHPIFDLLKRSENIWNNKLDKSSKTLKEAVLEYRRRYGRNPPKGFDAWFAFALENNVKLIDEYDQINRDLSPFLGFNPAYLITKQQEWESKKGSFYLECKDGKVFYAGASNSSDPGEKDVSALRGEEQLKLLRPVEKFLPNFRATFSAHDVPNQFVGQELKSDLQEAIDGNEFMDTSALHLKDNYYLGWASSCSTDKPLWEDKELRTKMPDMDKVYLNPKTFIHDHFAAMDACTHTDLIKNVGFFSSHGLGPGPAHQFHPTFALCTTRLHSDILSVAMEQYTDKEDLGEDPIWERKPHNKLLWRGSNTGILYEEKTRDIWKISQRVRLVAQTNDLSGKQTLIIPSSHPASKILEPEWEFLSLLNDNFMDIKFTGKPIQCTPEFCEELSQNFDFQKSMDWNEGNTYKYILDMDGNGWSARFQRLMSTNSLILKATVFPEWYTDRIQPWVHYVPVKMDLSDLYDVMTFFRGEVITGEGGHDSIAKKIASAGKEWAETYWRRVDLTAYVFRLFLEYNRVMSLDRDAATFHFEE